jgi:hypothetical protein
VIKLFVHSSRCKHIQSGRLQIAQQNHKQQSRPQTTQQNSEQQQSRPQTAQQSSEQQQSRL